MKSPRCSVAVIIPAYNAERTLERTVQSVLSQTLKDIQVIIVDDGSSDGTAAIADGLAGNHDHVKVIHQQNGGGYAARLAGLRVMNASYFGFVDADDVIEPRMFETLLDYAKLYNLDIVQCGIVGGNGNNQVFEFLDENDFKDRIVRKVLLQGGGAALVWDKLYRNQYQFDKFADADFVQWDDHALNLYFFQNVRAYGIVHRGFYDYNTRSETSVTRKYNKLTLHWYREIIEWRRHIAIVSYKMSEYDDAVWITRTARNLFVMMSCVEFPSWDKRCDSVCQLFSEPAVRCAYTYLSRMLPIWNKYIIFWYIAAKFPRSMIVLIHFLKKLKA